MAQKDRYVLDGEGWLRIGLAARLAGTNGAGIRARMADGSMGWRQLCPGSPTMLVREADVQALRIARAQFRREGAFKPPPRPRAPKPAPPRARGPGLWDRTWDPAPGPRTPQREE